MVSEETMNYALFILIGAVGTISSVAAAAVCSWCYVKGRRELNAHGMDSRQDLYTFLDLRDNEGADTPPEVRRAFIQNYRTRKGIGGKNARVVRDLPYSFEPAEVDEEAARI